MSETKLEALISAVRAKSLERLEAARALPVADPDTPPPVANVALTVEALRTIAEAVPPTAPPAVRNTVATVLQAVRTFRPAEEVHLLAETLLEITAAAAAA